MSFHEIDLSIKTEQVTLDLGDRNDDDVIAALFEADANYKDDLPYTHFPDGTGEFNSNSYVSGLLQAVGLAAPALESNVPGYEHPMPAVRFREPVPQDGGRLMEEGSSHRKESTGTTQSRRLMKGGLVLLAALTMLGLVLVLFTDLFLLCRSEPRSPNTSYERFVQDHLSNRSSLSSKHDRSPYNRLARSQETSHNG